MSSVIQGALTNTPLADLIELMGLRHVSKYITDKSFPLPCRLWTTYKEFQFNKILTSEEVVERMRIMGYEPANSHELLLWDGCQSDGSVIALGSVVRTNGTHRVVLILFGFKPKRDLCLLWNWPSYKWQPGCTFLGVKRPFNY